MIARHVRFLATALGLTAFFILAPLFVIGSETYCRHSEVYWDAADCYKFAVRDRAADIVFVGDSSLQYGVRPKLMTEATGLTGFNLGLPAGNMVFLPDLLLDRYLERNARPRLIILYLSPWSVLGDAHADPKAVERLWVDAARVALRHADLAQQARIFGGDPRRLIELPSLFLQQGWGQFSRSGAWWHQASAIMAEENGWLPFWRAGGLNTVGPVGWWGFSADAPAKQPASLEDDCVLAAKPVDPSGEAIRAFRRKYEGGGTRVAVYVAPLPACDQSRDAVAAAWRGVADNQPQALPGHDFIDDGWRVHMNETGAADATALVTAFVRTVLADGGPPSSPELAVRPAAPVGGQPE